MFIQLKVSRYHYYIEFELNHKKYQKSNFVQWMISDIVKSK